MFYTIMAYNDTECLLKVANFLKTSICNKNTFFEQHMKYTEFVMILFKLDSIVKWCWVPVKPV